MIRYKNMSLATQVMEVIEESILSEKYKRGDIISESRLSEELGVSRTPIREALGRLMEDGLVEDSPNGTMVVGVSDEDVTDYYGIKKVMEGEAAARAANHITDEQIKELRDLIDQQEFYEGKDDHIKVRDLDTQLHGIIYEASGSRVMQQILSGIHRHLIRYRYRSLAMDDGDRMHQSILEHKEIVDAIAAHDPERARTAMSRHQQNAKENMQRLRAKQNEE